MKKLILLCVSLLSLSAIGITAMASFKISQMQSETLPLSLPLYIDIEKGESVNSLASRLEAMGIVDSAFWIKLLVRFDYISPAIKAGEYVVDSPVTLIDLFSVFATGDVVHYQITFPEGWTLQQVVQELSRHPKLEQTITDENVKDIPEKLGVTGSAEGWIFPDTYRYIKGDQDISILRRAREVMQKTLTVAWEGRSLSNLSSAIETPYDALILASLIERETSVGAERGTISSVFHNRLNVGMKLQTDPTVIYALGEAYDGNIRRSDLRVDSPYNTYRYRGLPPTPIAMPGKDSILAALNPAQTKYIFFVAKGDGHHQFSETLQEHNRAVQNYQIKKRKENYKSTPGK
ncbi:MAG: endolytic transglycosylase MltG [Hahellaceae bacterium]|nr:endolytic transglycosylase MltG [Hahellaceae bacterium]MCP5212074.1 endolytic transglycosylase MltG [Hahellaceae bacterium]